MGVKLEPAKLRPSTPRGTFSNSGLSGWG